MHKKIIFALVVATILIAITGFMYKISQPVNGVVKEASVERVDDTIHPSPQFINTNYATFSLPGTAKQLPRPDSSDTANLLYAIGETGLIRISVSFQTINGTTIDTVSSYNFRNKTPDIYDHSQTTVKNTETHIFTKHDNTELATFLVGKEVTAIIVISSQSKEVKVSDNLLESVLKSWHWL